MPTEADTKIELLNGAVIRRLESAGDAFILRLYYDGDELNDSGYTVTDFDDAEADNLGRQAKMESAIVATITASGADLLIDQAKLYDATGDELLSDTGQIKAVTIANGQSKQVRIMFTLPRDDVREPSLNVAMLGCRSFLEDGDFDNESLINNYLADVNNRRPLDFAGQLYNVDDTIVLPKRSGGKIIGGGGFGQIWADNQYVESIHGGAVGGLRGAGLTDRAIVESYSASNKLDDLVIIGATHATSRAALVATANSARAMIGYHQRPRNDVVDGPLNTGVGTGQIEGALQVQLCQTALQMGDDDSYGDDNADQLNLTLLYTYLCDIGLKLCNAQSIAHEIATLRPYDTRIAVQIKNGGGIHIGTMTLLTANGIGFDTYRVHNNGNIIKVDNLKVDAGAGAGTKIVQMNTFDDSDGGLTEPAAQAVPHFIFGGAIDNSTTLTTAFDLRGAARLTLIGFENLHAGMVKSTAVNGLGAKVNLIACGFRHGVTPDQFMIANPGGGPSRISALACHDDWGTTIETYEAEFLHGVEV